MLISELNLAHNTVFEGYFRIRRPRMRVANNGNLYLSAYIEDRSGELKVYYWRNNESSALLKDLDRVTVKGVLRWLNNDWIVNLVKLEILQLTTITPVKLLPRSLTPLPTLLYQLNDIVLSIKSVVLKQFTLEVLNNDDISFPFVSLPASRRNHHCTGSGLLEHSLECVAMVSRFEEFSKPILDLAIVGALFHDIGKIRTMQNTGNQHLSGYVLNHNSLTLEVLSSHLQKLDGICPESAVALRYLWTWQNMRDSRNIPLLTVAEAITAADRISAGLNNEERLFRERPDWQRFGKFDGVSTLWRPRLAASTDTGLAMGA